MHGIDFKTQPFSINNPYKSFIPSLEDLGFKSNAQIREKDKVLAFADRIIDWGKAHFSKDYEKQIGFVGKTANILDWGVCGVVGGMEAVVIVDKMVRPFHMNQFPVLNTFPSLLKIIMIPSAISFLIMAVFQGFVEFLNLRRAGYFLHNIEKRKKDPLDGLQWLKEKYFTLNKSEGQKIHQYIKQKFPGSPCNEKAKAFDQIAEKVLHVKYDSLKRRISPGLAKEVVSQLDIITKDLRSIFPWKRTEATQRAEILMQSLTRQAKNKILIHFLGILAITCTLISMPLFLSGVGAGPFFAILGTIAFALTIISLIIDKGIVAKEVEKFYDSLAIHIPVKNWNFGQEAIKFFGSDKLQCS
ncbi:MAG: hypothetical protein K1000chlam3_01131 [Chlamydiae bacterium]|nr:hypothetical protein [Chlamydiota bacterium]